MTSMVRVTRPNVVTWYLYHWANIETEVVLMWVYYYCWLALHLPHSKTLVRDILST